MNVVDRSVVDVGSLAIDRGGTSLDHRPPLLSEPGDWIEYRAEDEGRHHGIEAFGWDGEGLNGHPAEVHVKTWRVWQLSRPGQHTFGEIDGCEVGTAWIIGHVRVVVHSRLRMSGCQKADHNQVHGQAGSQLMGICPTLHGRGQRGRVEQAG